MPAYRPIEERFAQKYRVNKETGCWEWTATKITGGYGHIRLPRNAGLVLAHRFAYQHLVGPIPEGLLVCHKCDNPGCVNPEHLFVETHEENMRDMQRKGRARLLSRDSIAEARRMLTSGYSLTAVAKMFGVARQTLTESVRREGAEKGPYSLAVGKYTKLTEDQRAEICTRLAAKEPILRIAAAFNVDRKTVRNIRDSL